MKEIFINDVKFVARDYEEEFLISEPTGNELRKITLNIELIGETMLDRVKSVLDESNNFDVKIPEVNLEMRMKKGNNSYSYQGSNMNESTRISYSITFTELDKDLPEDWNSLVAIAETAIMNWIRTRAIGELFIEKGLLTQKEYEDKIGTVAERDFEKLRKYVTYGIPESKEE